MDSTYRLMQENIADIRQALAQVPDISAFVGFDGFVDVISKAVKSYDNHGGEVYFDTMSEFGDFIRARAGKSCSAELKTIARKVGGNAPLTAFALQRLGVAIRLVGSLGYPQIDPLFLGELSENDSAYTGANAGVATAIEFSDGKIMMGANNALEGLGWQEIKDAVGLDCLVKLFRECDILCLLNWSEVVRSNEIWAGLLGEVVPAAQPSKDKLMCFDLTDFARRRQQDVHEMVALLNCFAAHYRVVLNLNQNEHALLYRAVIGTEPPPRLCDSRLADALNVSILCIHHHDGCLAFERGSVYECGSFHVDAPAVLTGAGDNFNGGLMLALALGLPVTAGLLVASAVSSYYVRVGHGPTRRELMDYVEEWRLVLQT